MMSTISNSESSTSSSQSAWWTPSSWVPDTTEAPSSTISTSFSDFSLTSTESFSPTFLWTDTGFSTVTDSASSSSALSSPSSSPTLTVMLSSTSSLSRPIETQVSHDDVTSRTSQSPKSAPVKLKTEQIVAMSIGAFVGLLLIGGVLVYLFIRHGNRRTNHKRIYSDPDEKHFGDFTPNTSFNNTGNDDGAVVPGRDSLGGPVPSYRILDRSYYNERRSLSDGGATSITPLLQPSLSQSDNRGPERDSSSFSFGLGDMHESPISQFRSAGSFDGELPSPSSPSSPSAPPRYSRIHPQPPILRPPRPLPIPKNPRLLEPQRRSDSIQVRLQSRPPLISSSTTSLPLFPSPPSNPSSPPSSSSPSSPPSFTGLRNTDPFITEQLPPLLPQRRTRQSIKGTPSGSSWSSSSIDLSPVSPFRPTPSVSFKDIQHPNSSTNPKSMILKLRRKQQNARKRSSQSGSLSLTSESFRCAGEKAIHDKVMYFSADEGGFPESPPSAYSPMQTTGGGTLIDTQVALSFAES